MRQILLSVRIAGPEALCSAKIQRANPNLVVFASEAKQSRSLK